ncbi:hypothetical protein LIPSTDRAFT_75460 [Lipomyces starkeyi NRRL Y-11557]|uniref:Secreted protein n=1 Tax=Lipomyces starkeyi NRRL Y-11557 TaxID=675824 RepID=A0A1E3PX14_LIPST|nr:hypothetical protein LIPSTDRAFT_75460 [Lipomyces starkeyi NRRL Y-11557]
MVACAISLCGCGCHRTLLFLTFAVCYVSRGLLGPPVAHSTISANNRLLASHVNVFQIATGPTQFPDDVSAVETCVCQQFLSAREGR